MTKKAQDEMIRNNFLLFKVVYRMFECNVANGYFSRFEYYKELVKLQSSLSTCIHFAEMLLTEKERKEIK